jgi:serine/tyrosine/threonine adenylyltransferase
LNMTIHPPIDAAAFDNSYARLPDRFFARQKPTPVATPRLVRLNEDLARDLGLDPARLRQPAGVAMLAGNLVPDGADAIATAYAGHQFGGFQPQLGDGRAVLLGEVIDRAGQRRDIQLKGAGPTPFSRSGDGRAALGPVLREYIISETMAAFKVPTTRALAAVTTGEIVRRDAALPGAVLTRVASSHIRVGTFQFFASRGDESGVRLLADYVIARHYPQAARSPHPYRALLEGIVAAQASLIARWLMVGFIHGVMNTDNASIAGETIDYGPCAFMDAYHPGTVYSSIDHRGRYAYGNQPHIAQWNLSRLAETLLPLLSTDKDEAVATAQATVDGFTALFEQHYIAGFSAKIGLATAAPDDVALIQDLLKAMSAHEVDFTLLFRRLGAAARDAANDTEVRALFADPTAYDAWAVKWRARLADEGGTSMERARAMDAVNPAFIPRNHLVEEVIVAATKAGDFAPFERLLTVLARPFDDQPEHASFTLGPRSDQVVAQTFCGT